MPVRAILYRDRGAFREAALPGSYAFDGVNGVRAMWFCCPCGCGSFARIVVALGAKPAASPSWAWDGSETEPSLTPSINQLNCGWHGWLRDGYWEAC